MADTFYPALNEFAALYFGLQSADWLADGQAAPLKVLAVTILATTLLSAVRRYRNKAAAQTQP